MSSKDVKYRLRVTIPADGTAGFVWQRLAQQLGLPEQNQQEILFAPVVLTGDQVFRIVEEEHELRWLIRNEHGTQINGIALEIVE